MIAKITRGSDFRGLQLYLMSEHKGLAPEDVETRCLVSVDTASAEMHLAASRSERTKKAVYHIILAWAEEERPSRDKQFAAGHELLERVGLGGHQALLVRHTEPKAGTTPGAGRHYELHLMVNRVGPDGRAAAMRNDYHTVECIGASIAAAHAMRVVPGRHNGLAGFVQGSSEQARSVASAIGRLSPAMALRADPSAMADLTRARAQGWTALIEAFAHHGLVLKESNRTIRAGQSAGLVLVDVRDTARREKISALDTPDLKWGLTTLQRELGEFPKELAPTIGFMATKAHVDGGEPSPPHPEHGRDTFAAARIRALAERRRVSKAYAEEKRRLRQEQGQERERLSGLAAERRRQVKVFFGRSSELGRALNQVLDVGSADRLTKRKAADEQALQKLMERHRRELSLVPVPTWADWQRSHGVHEPEPAVVPGPCQDQSPASPPGSSTVERDEALRASRRTTAALVVDIGEHEARAERLRCNRERKAAVRRGDLDARIESLLDQACTAVAAEVVRHLSPRHGTRLTVLMIAALALGSGVAPVVLAAAAVALLHRGGITSAHAQLRADVDDARAAKTEWSFRDTAVSDRGRYAALVRSDLIVPAGPDATPLIAALGREEVARFVAWWAYASPKQRAVVTGWGRPLRQRSAPARPRPARRQVGQEIER